MGPFVNRSTLIFTKNLMPGGLPGFCCRGTCHKLVGDYASCLVSAARYCEESMALRGAEFLIHRSKFIIVSNFKFVVK